MSDTADKTNTVGDKRKRDEAPAATKRAAPKKPLHPSAKRTLPGQRSAIASDPNMALFRKAQRQLRQETGKLNVAEALNRGATGNCGVLQKLMSQSQDTQVLSQQEVNPSPITTPRSAAGLAPNSSFGQPPTSSITERFLERVNSEKSLRIDQVVSARGVGQSGVSPGGPAELVIDNDETSTASSASDAAVMMMPDDVAGSGSHTLPPLEKDNESDSSNDSADEAEHTKSLLRKHEMKRLQSHFVASNADAGASQSQLSQSFLATSRPQTPTGTPTTVTAEPIKPLNANNNVPSLEQALQRPGVMASKLSKAFSNATAADASLLRRTNSFENSSKPMVFGGNK